MTTPMIEFARWATSARVSQYNFMLKDAGNWPADGGGAKFFLDRGVWTLIATWTGASEAWITVRTTNGNRNIVSETIPAGKKEISATRVFEVPINEPAYVNFGVGGFTAGDTMGMKAINAAETITI